MLFLSKMNSSESLTCFLLNYSSHDSRGHFEISLYAVTTDHIPVKITIDNYRPLFFIPRTLSHDFTTRATERKELPLTSLGGTAVDCLYFSTWTAYQECARQLKNQNVIVYESDLHPVDRFLMERFVCGGFQARGPFTQKEGTICMRNPQIRGCDMSPSLQVMSFDIETNAETGELYSIACSGISDLVFIIGSSPVLSGTESSSSEINIFYCKNEAELLARFFTHVQSENPDILIGWNVVDFDLNIIQDRCAALSVPFAIGRDSGARILQTPSSRQHFARIPGRVVMDIPLLLRTYYRPFEEYSLNFVASELLNQTKEIELRGAEKIAEIHRQFREDKAALASYNLQDARLTKQIFEKTDILPNSLERTKRSGQLLDRTGGSIAAFDYLYLPRLHRAGFVAGDITDTLQSSVPLPGGYVVEPEPGVYENVLVFDFRSLYPSIILTFKIDPLAYHISSSHRIQTPAGASFSADTHILPGKIEQLLQARMAAKKENNPHLSQAIKILMNSFYGVLGSQGCRFFSPELATAITKTGQYILKTTIKHINDTTPYSVIYGDTDSLFVLLGPGKEQSAATVGTKLAMQITTWLSEHLKTHFNVQSALFLQYENHFRHFLIPSVRGATHGSKKHYCGSIHDDSEMKLLFKGMESARSDWTDLAKEFQHELICRLFQNEPVEDYILDIVGRVRRSELDEKLIYKKRLRKRIEEYTTNIPPHAQAARLLQSPHPLIRYYITVDGPQPLQRCTSPLDYDHYIYCQLQPVADSVLEWTGKSFSAILSGQQDLFSI